MASFNNIDGQWRTSTRFPPPRKLFLFVRDEKLAGGIVQMLTLQGRTGVIVADGEENISHCLEVIDKCGVVSSPTTPKELKLQVKSNRTHNCTGVWLIKDGLAYWDDCTDERSGK